jgi:hypothetical protein
VSNDEHREQQHWQALVQNLKAATLAGDGKGIPSIDGHQPPEGMDRQRVEILIATWAICRYLEFRGIDPKYLRALHWISGAINDAENGAVNRLFRPAGPQINDIVMADCLVMAGACALIHGLVDVGEFPNARAAAKSVAEQFAKLELHADYRAGWRDPSRDGASLVP